MFVHLWDLMGKHEWTFWPIHYYNSLSCHKISIFHYISISHLPVHFILISLYEADSLCICIRAFLNQSLCIWPREIHNQHFCVKYIIQGHTHATLKWLSADLLLSENYQIIFSDPTVCVFSSFIYFKDQFSNYYSKYVFTKIMSAVT